MWFNEKCVEMFRMFTFLVRFNSNCTSHQTCFMKFIKKNVPKEFPRIIISLSIQNIPTRKQMCLYFKISIKYHEHAWRFKRYRLDILFCLVQLTHTLRKWKLFFYVSLLSWWNKHICSIVYHILDLVQTILFHAITKGWKLSLLLMTYRSIA